jgi:tetratricopeptide (TPR) repeat protein
MNIVEILSAVALRQQIDGTAGPNVSTESLDQSLSQAFAQTWQAVEVALAGMSWFAEVQGQLPAEAAPIGALLQGPVGRALENAPPAARMQARRELRASREAGLITAPPGSATVLPHLPDRIGDLGPLTVALQPNAPTLADLLTIHPTALLLPLVVFVRRALDAKPELAQAIPGRGTAPEGDWSALAAFFESQSAPLDKLLEPPPPPPPGPEKLSDLVAEAAGAPEPAPALAEAVSRLLKQYELPERALRPSDTAAINAPGDRKRVQELAARVHGLPDDLRPRLPSLLHGLAMLEVAANELEAAQRDFQAVINVLRDPPSLAAACHNAYQAALERRDWFEALRFWRQAASLEPEQYASFPLSTYTPERIVGVSGPGVLFLCTHQPTGRQVVVHALWPDSLDLGVADVFRESRMLQQLDHPARVGLLDCAYADTNRRMPFLATDHFEGVSLSYFVRQHGPLGPADLLRILKPVAEVVLAAHQRGVLHRAITPGSLFVRRDDTGWHAKLIDFGLAISPASLHTPLTASPDWSRTLLGASVLATIPYIAPEQFGWVDGASTGPASDVYSFGKLCYFALLGTPEPDDEEKTLLPPGWRKFLGACTARSVTRRLPNFQAVLKQLTQLPTGEEEPRPTPAVPARPTAPPRTPGGLVVGSPSQHGVPKPPPLPPLVPPTQPPLQRPRPLSPSRQGVTRIPAAIGDMRGENESVAALLNQGMTFKQQGDVPKALAAFDKAIQLDPKSAAAYIKRGNVHSDNGDLSQAIADYTSALKADPESALAYMNRGLAHAKRGEFDAVLADCTEAIRIDKKLAAAYFIRGAAYSSRGERHRAIAEFTLALRLDPNNALAFNDRGLAFAEQGEYDRALRDYTAALRIDPRLVLAYVNRGIAFRLKKQPGRAVEDLSKALRLDQRNIQARFQRGMALTDLERYEDAIGDLTRVLQMDLSHPEAAIKREEAQKLLAKAGPRPTVAPAAPPVSKPPVAATAPKGPSVVRPAAPASGVRPSAGAPAASPPRPTQGPKGRPTDGRNRPRPQVVAPKRPVAPVSPEEAARKRETSADDERRQSRAAAYFTRGRDLFEQEEFEQAIEQFNKALEADPKDPVTFYHRGLAYEELEEFDEAIADFTDVLRLEPRNAMAYYHRGNSYRLSGQNDRAIADTTKALRLDPRLALAYRNRSLAYAAIGERDRARADYEEAIRLDPALARE